MAMTSPAPSPTTLAQPHAFNSQVESVAQSLRETANEVASIENAALRLAAGGNERAAAGEQVSAQTASIAGAVEETGATVARMTRTQQGLSDLAQSLLSDVEESSAALREVASSVAGVKKDTLLLAESSDNTAA